MGPLEFARGIELDTLWERQCDVLRAIERHPRVTVRSGHGVGKTHAAAVAAVWFLAEHTPVLVTTTAPTFRQVRDVLWPEIRRLWQRTQFADRGVGQVNRTEIRLTDCRRAFGFSTNEPQRLQGLHCENILVIVDEAGGVPAEIYEAVMGLLTSRNSRLLLIGNPVSPSGFFYDSHKPGSGFERLHISCADSPNVIERREVVPGLVTAEWIEAQRAQWGAGSAAYASRVLGEFPAEGEDCLIPLGWVEEAMRREIPPLDRDSQVLGVDVARFGSDRTVMILRDRYALRHVVARQGQDTMATAGALLALAREQAIPARRVRIDDTGLGGGVTDRLREQGFAAVAVNMAGRAVEADRFANVRAECYWLLREALDPVRGLSESRVKACLDPTTDNDARSRRGKACLTPFSDGGADRPLALPPGSDALAAECIAPRFSYTSRGQIRLEGKDEIRARLGRSPDLADALALTFVPAPPEPRAIWL